MIQSNQVRSQFYFLIDNSDINLKVKMKKENFINFLYVDYTNTLIFIKN
jgi:hypothetical protein